MDARSSIFPDISFDYSGLQGLYDIGRTLRLLTHRHVFRRYWLDNNKGLVNKEPSYIFNSKLMQYHRACIYIREVAFIFIGLYGETLYNK